MILPSHKTQRDRLQDFVFDIDINYGINSVHLAAQVETTLTRYKTNYTNVLAIPAKQYISTLI